jgi:hypothetical protein
MGHVMVGFGILALISIFLPPIASIIVIAAMIVVMLIMPFI